MSYTCPRCGQVNERWGPCTTCLNVPSDDLIVPAAAPRRPGRIVVALALVVALLLAGGVGAGVVLGRNDGRNVATPVETAGGEDEDKTGEDETGEGVASDLRALAAQLSDFVESARGLAFKEDVEVVLLDDEAFRDRLLENADFDPEELGQIARVLRALALLEGEVDLEQAMRDLLGAAVVGFYDPETGELVVRGADPSPAVRITLVHELTHALQDQHFELHRPALDDRDDEAGQAFSGLVEGDAERIADLYRDSLTDAERKQAEREQVEQSAALALTAADIPPVLIDLLTFPYAVGPRLVDALVEAGRIDAAFSDPPTTSEHLLHPDRYLDGHAPLDVDPPQAAGEVIDEGVLGELGFLLLLQHAVEAQDAFQAADGWGGDWYVAWDDGDVTCVRATVVMDSDADARELATALEAWAEDHPDARITAAEAIELNACA